MLLELRVRNFAIINELNLSFARGLNVITGETGAGKSIILNAVHLLLGGRASEEAIRSSEEEANMEAMFDISDNPDAKDIMKEKALKIRNPEEEEALVVRRVISRSGRGKTFVNENLVTLGMLSEIGEKLLSVYGQHEHQSLQRVEIHIDILDEFGGLLDLREEFREHFTEYLSISDEVKRIREERERRTKEQELMSFQLRELEASGVRAGEEEALREERKLLSHARKLAEFASLAEEMLYDGEGSTIERLHGLFRQGREMAAIDPSLDEPVKGLETASIQLEEVALGLRSYLKKVDIDPVRLEAVENRMEEIETLKRKYGRSAEDLIDFKNRIEETLNSFVSHEEKLSQLEGIMGSLQGEMMALAQRLSWERKKVASDLKRSVEKELGSLGMKRTTFEVRLEDLPLSDKGKDRVEFLISPNVGEEVKPLSKIASGGELSRMMLAIKKILAKVGGKQVLVFDEVDSGIGGAIAEVIGRKLKELSKDHQVICVTHLPQIACFADAHHSVRKEVKGGRTFTSVEQLSREAVVDEIARMLGGLKITEKTRVHAKEMIDHARQA